MNTTYVILLAISMLSASGIPALFFARKSVTGQRITTLIMVTGSLVGLSGIILSFFYSAGEIVYAWSLPFGQFSVALDTISSFFLLLIFIVPALASLYGLSYWKQSEHPETGRQLGLFLGLLTGSIALICIARSGVLFLFAWESMALSIFFLVTTENENPDVRQAGWVYLIATHLGTLCLFALFVLWNFATGSFELVPAATISTTQAHVLFLLALLGFGIKAGLMPFHIWLPGAHASAPSHVSAMLSGVILNMGVYGIIRMTSILPVAHAWWGSTLLIIGVISAIGGIAYAIGQSDLKKMLAYSSIENMGITFIGLGLALMGRYYGHTDWIILGLGGSLFHLLNHGLIKPLLFFNAGSIIHTIHTRKIDAMGGLAKQMPHSMLLFAFGSVAICALPPLNGFIGEWLLYIGLFKTLGLGADQGVPIVALAAVAISFVGALAVAAFVKLFSTIFLGSSRTAHTAHAQDCSLIMRVPMYILAGLSLCIGLLSFLLFPFIETVIGCWISATPGEISIAHYAPTHYISIVGTALIAVLLIVYLKWNRSQHKQKIPQGVTWDCGYAEPGARMQYTGSSFGHSLVALLRGILWPHYTKPVIKEIFPAVSMFKIVVPDVILDRMIIPWISAIHSTLKRFYVVQQGNTRYYILSILIIVVLLLILGADS